MLLDGLLPPAPGLPLRNPAVREVLEGMLEWEPAKRKTIDEVLEMAYCQLGEEGEGLVPEGSTRPDQVQLPRPIMLR